MQARFGWPKNDLLTRSMFNTPVNSRRNQWLILSHINPSGAASKISSATNSPHVALALIELGACYGARAVGGGALGQTSYLIS
jgi:hypothetical protein